MTIQEPDMQTLGGFLNFSLHPLMHQFLNRKTSTSTHPEIHTYSHMHTMALTQAHLCLRLLQVQKCECENEQARKEGPRMRCVIHFHRGGWGQPAAEESLPIVHVHRTHMHMSDWEWLLPQLSPICCNICQRKVKMSVNWGYFTHLAISASHSLSSRSQLRLCGGGQRLSVGGGASNICH